MAKFEEPTTPDEMFEACLAAVNAPFAGPMHQEGITPAMLAKRLKQELNWKETKTIKVKGAVDPESLPRAVKVVAVSDGETILKWDEKAGGVRQKARQDAIKLMGLEPAARHEVSFPPGLLAAVIDGLGLSDAQRRDLLSKLDEFVSA